MHLSRAALAAGSETIVVDLLTGQIEPPSVELDARIADFHESIDNLLRRARVEREQVRSVTTTIRYVRPTFLQRLAGSTVNLGRYRAVVELFDDRGTKYEAVFDRESV